MNYPEHEQPIRRELGLAMVKFIKTIMSMPRVGDEWDPVIRRSATEEYRQAVLEAERAGIEVSLTWHTLAVWTESGKERIGYFAKALECSYAESKANPPQTPVERWSSVHTQADCLFEIGRVHFHEGAPDSARRFLLEALPLAQKADALRVNATDDRLEGRIAELLLQLPDEEQ